MSPPGWVVPLLLVPDEAPVPGSSPARWQAVSAASKVSGKSQFHHRLMRLFIAIFLLKRTGPDRQWPASGQMTYFDVPDGLVSVELSEPPPEDMPLSDSLPLMPPDELPELLPDMSLSPVELPPDMSLPPMEPPELLPDMSLPPVELPELLPDMSLPPVELPDVPAPPGVEVLPGLEAPPEVPDGGVLLVPPEGGGSVVAPGAAPGGSEGGGVDGVVVDGMVLSGVAVVPVSPPPPPRLQAATLIVSRPINIRILEAFSFEFIAIPFN